MRSADPLPLCLASLLKEAAERLHRRDLDIAEETLRAVEHEQDERERVDNHARVREARECRREECHDECARDRAGHRAEAAHDDHDEDVERLHKRERGGAEDIHIMSEEHARNTRKECANAKCEHFVARRVHAH